MIFFHLQKGSGLWPATYTLIPGTEGNEKCLDPNHTHFLLVDNGTTNQNGLEVKFRDELERQIANTKTGNSQGSLYEKWRQTFSTKIQSLLQFFFNLQNLILLIADVNIPMIRLLIEGGRDCLESVQTSIRSGIPVIVVKVTGCLVNCFIHSYPKLRWVRVSFPCIETQLYRLPCLSICSSDE